MKFIKTEAITIKKNEQLKYRLLLSIDAGNTYIKILFLNKNKKEQLFNDDVVFLILELNSFHKEDFVDALEWIRNNAFIPEDNTYRVHITGSYAIQHQNKIQSILKREILVIDEYQAVAIGCKFAIEYIGMDKLLAKPIHFESYGEVDSDMFKMLKNSWKNKCLGSKCETDVMHPCMFYVQGSSSAIYCFDENGTCEYFRSAHLGSSTLFGLSKCLSNTNEVNEIISLVSKGNNLNVDTQAKELIDENIDSPYGKFPPELPAFPFGKCMDYNIGMDILSKEDVSNSLVILFFHKIFEICTSISYSKQVSKIYICGGILNSELLRKELMKVSTRPIIMIKPDILDFNYSAVLGAMVFNEKDKLSKVSIY